MKHIFICLLTLPLLFSCEMGEQSTLVDTIPSPGSEMIPVIVSRDDFEDAIEYQEPKDLENPGKIYVYMDQLLVVDKGKGFQIYDNSDPSNPVSTAFIRVPGCVDVGAKNGFIYADNQPDLVALTIGQNTVTVASRIREVFHEQYPPGFNHMPDKYNKDNRPAGTVIMGWRNINE